MHIFIDKTIHNNSAKDDIIHGIARFLITLPSNPSTHTTKYFITHILSSYFGKQLHNTTYYAMFCHLLNHSVTKSLFYNHFQVPSATFTTTLRFRVIITSSADIVLMACIFFQLVCLNYFVGLFVHT